jgi:3-deoxy-D-manno-octulosonate 8-phosphate phosphatase (KDO 8-P phosphatase)
VVNFADIKLLVLDVDGVMTDGTITINADNSESKSFNSLDGHGIRMWQRAGLKVAILSGRNSAPTYYRAAQLNIEYVFQDCHDKLPVLKKLIEQLSLKPQQVAFVGDDVPDLPVLRYVGFAASVANAVEEVKDCADYVTNLPGGKGAVREVIEHILKKSGKWQELMERYLS